MTDCWKVFRSGRYPLAPYRIELHWQGRVRACLYTDRPWPDPGLHAQCLEDGLLEELGKGELIEIEPVSHYECKQRVSYFHIEEAVRRRCAIVHLDRLQMCFGAPRSVAFLRAETEEREPSPCPPIADVELLAKLARRTQLPLAAWPTRPPPLHDGDLIFVSAEHVVCAIDWFSFPEMVTALRDGDRFIAALAKRADYPHRIAIAQFSISDLLQFTDPSEHSTLLATLSKAQQAITGGFLFVSSRLEAARYIHAHVRVSLQAHRRRLLDGLTPPLSVALSALSSSERPPSLKRLVRQFPAINPTVLAEHLNQLPARPSQAA